MSSLISDKKKLENLGLADEAYKKAKKKSGTTLLRWKPDWEAASRFYRDAVKYYKLSGPGHEAQTVLALKESAIAHKEILSFHTAAADLEAAGTIVRDEMKDAKEAATLFAEAATLYRQQGSSFDKAAATLVKAADAIGETDVNAGVEYMKTACAIYEEENRGEFHDATFKKAICFCVNNKKYGSARSLLSRQITIAQTHLNTFEIDIYKNCLSIIVLRFHTEDYEKASEDIQKFEQIARFSKSEYCTLANELLSAWEDGDADRFNAAVKSNSIKYLLNPIAVIARKLSMPEDVAQEPGGKKSKSSAGSSSSSAPPAKKKPKGRKIELDDEEGEGGEGGTEGEEGVPDLR